MDPRLVSPQMVCGSLTRIKTKALEAEVNLNHSSGRRQGISPMIPNVKSPFSIPLPIEGCLAAFAVAWSARETDPWVTQVITEGYRMP